MITDSAFRSTCCRATSGLAAQEFATLVDPLSRFGQVVLDPVCELAAGHEGSHVAFAVAAEGGDQWWWVYWDKERAELIDIDPCPAERYLRPWTDSCLLPDRHPGPHSFEISSANRNDES